MSAVKLNFSLDAQVATLMRQRAAELKIPASRYLADLILQDVRRQQDDLAAEGYRVLSADTAAFADSALALASEVWPQWDPSERSSVTTAPGTEAEDAR